MVKFAYAEILKQMHDRNVQSMQVLAVQFESAAAPKILTLL